MVRKLGIPLLSVALLCSLPATSHADSITYTASGTGNGGDGPVSGSALFVTGNGTVTITLTNTLTPGTIVDAGEALSDLSFTLSNAPGTSTVSGTASGQMANLTYVKGTGGNPSYDTEAYTTGSPTRWLGVGGGTPGISGDTVTLETIGGGQPSEMILPYLANGGTYTNGNQGLPNFDAYVIGPATFVINLPGVTSSTAVTAATFSWGTSPDTFLQGTPTSVVPEPSSLALLGTGILGAAAAMRRRFASGLKQG